MNIKIEYDRRTKTISVSVKENDRKLGVTSVLDLRPEEYEYIIPDGLLKKEKPTQMDLYFLMIVLAYLMEKTVGKEEGL